MRVSLERVVNACLGVAVGLAVLGVPWGITLSVTIFCWRLAGSLKEPAAALTDRLSAR